MGRPSKPLRERIDRLSHRQNDHLIWRGQMRGGRPHLDRVGNPARILLNLTEHPDYQIRKECPEDRCIDPHHYRVIRERRRKYDDQSATPWRDPRDPNISKFTHQELDEIETMLRDGFEEAELQFFPPHMQEEIRRRI